MGNLRWVMDCEKFRNLKMMKARSSAAPKSKFYGSSKYREMGLLPSYWMTGMRHQWELFIGNCNLHTYWGINKYISMRSSGCCYTRRSQGVVISLVRYRFQASIRLPPMTRVAVMSNGPTSVLVHQSNRHNFHYPFCFVYNTTNQANQMDGISQWAYRYVYHNQ